MACGLAVVAVLSVGSTYQFEVMMAARGRPIEFLGELKRQGLQWGLWGLAAWPVAMFAGVLWRRVHPWPLALLLIGGFSVGVGWGHAELSSSLVEMLAPIPEQTSGNELENPSGRRRGPPDTGARGDASERSERIDRGSRGPRPGSSSFRAVRVPRSVLECWLMLGLISGCQIFLTSRREERRAAAAELAAANAREHLVAVQLDVLRGQVHPHFLFNALHAVGGLVREGDSERALGTLASLSDLLRYSLDLGGQQLVTLADELVLVQRYIDIEAIRFGDRLAWQTDIEPGAMAALVPSLALLPLVENAVRYAVEPRAIGGRLLLRGGLRDGDVWLEMADNGPGFSAAQQAGQPTADDGESHLGLSSTRDRLRMMYGGKGAFALAEATGGGALVTMSFPAGLTD
ncbi:MAG: hypothetical protein ACI9EF_001660 [Pseudohongiellaceae bacterium]|jgi:hypothetical protein